MTLRGRRRENFGREKTRRKVKPQQPPTQQQEQEQWLALQWGVPSHTRNSSTVHEFTGHSRKKINEASHINNIWRPLTVFMLFICRRKDNATDEDKSVLPPVLKHTQRWVISTPWYEWIWNVFLLHYNHTNRTLHTRQSDRLLANNRTILHPFL